MGFRWSSVNNNGNQNEDDDPPIKKALLENKTKQ